MSSLPSKSVAFRRVLWHNSSSEFRHLRLSTTTVHFALQLEIPSDARYLSVVRGAVRQLAQVVGFSDEESDNVTLAVDEAMSNIIRHAYEGRADEPIRLTCRRLALDGESAGGLEFLLEDHGRPVAPEEIRGRPLDDLRPGGLGMHLIAGVMDRVEYHPSPDGNRLRLVRYRPASKV